MTASRRVLVVAVVGALALAASILPAAAHVDVAPEQGTTVEVGANATLTVRVPNERDVGTVEVELIFPETFETVTAEPTTGWTVRADGNNTPTGTSGAVPLVLVHDGEEHEEPVPQDPPSTTVPAEPRAAPETFENVSALVWTGGPTASDETLEFVVTVGPVPDTPVLVFKALQTYEGGEVVRWIQEPADDGSALEFPAPVVEVSGATPVADDSAGTDGADTDGADTDAPAGTDTSDADDSDTWRTVLLVVAVILIVGGITARVVVQRRMHGSLREDSDDPDGTSEGGALR